jgi:hypothetical protein
MGVKPRGWSPRKARRGAYRIRGASGRGRGVADGGGRRASDLARSPIGSVVVCDWPPPAPSPRRSPAAGRWLASAQACVQHRPATQDSVVVTKRGMLVRYRGQDVPPHDIPG